MKLIVKKSGCMNCNMLKEYITSHNIQIDFVYAEDNMKYCREHNIKSVPALIVERVNESDEIFEEIIYGFEEIIKFMEA